MKQIQSKTANRIQRIIPSAVSITKALGVVALVLGSFTMKAGEGNTTTKTESIIQSGISFPKLSQPIKQSEKVKVVFITDEAGHVTYCLAKTPNAELKRTLEEQFKKFRLVDTQANVTYTVILNFKTL